MSEQDTSLAADRTHALIEGEAGITVARQSGLYRIRAEGDAGRNLYQSWQPEQKVATMAVAQSPNFAADGTILAGIHGGVARSSDAGASWEAKAIRVPPPLVTSLALSPAFATDGIVLAGSFEDGVFRSDDGGRSWGAFNFGLFDHNVYCLALSPGFAVDGVAFAGASSGIYRSENGGRFWHDLPMPSGDETVLSIAVSPQFSSDGTVLAGTEARGLLRSSDGGASWGRMNAPEGPVNAIIVLDAVDGHLRLAALIDDGAYFSASGEAWREVAASAVHAIAAGRDGSLLLGLEDGSVRRETL
jgi:photosystem II stability/assembly factor-like uncharacterized protein